MVKLWTTWWLTINKIKKWPTWSWTWRWTSWWPTWQLTCSKPNVKIKSLKCSKMKCIGPKLFDAKCTRLTCLLSFGSSFAPLRPAPWIFTLALSRGQNVLSRASLIALHERIDGSCYHLILEKLRDTFNMCFYRNQVTFFSFLFWYSRFQYQFKSQKISE